MTHHFVHQVQFLTYIFFSYNKINNQCTNAAQFNDCFPLIIKGAMLKD